MTDQIESLALQIKEIVDSGMPLEAIGMSLEQLWNAAQDEQQQALVATAWEQAQSLATVVTRAVDLSQAAVSVATEMVAQRDTIADELSNVVQQHDKLAKAVKDGEYGDHPLVDALIEQVQEQAYADFNEMAYDEGIHVDDPAEKIAEHGLFSDEFDTEYGEEIVELILFGGDMPDEMQTELEAFITDFVGRVKAYRHAKMEALRREWAAEREAAALRAQQQAIQGKAS